jgi:hypothetical protein
VDSPSIYRYIVAFKSLETEAEWQSNQALVSLKIHERVHPTNNGEFPFKFFDSATMLSYEFPPKTSEIIFCQRNPASAACEIGNGFNPEHENIPISLLEVKKSQEGENSGRGVFTTVDVPANSYIGLESIIHLVHFSPSTYEIIMDLTDENEFYDGDILQAFMFGYGFDSKPLVRFGLCMCALLVASALSVTNPYTCPLSSRFCSRPGENGMQCRLWNLDLYQPRLQ